MKNVPWRRMVLALLGCVFAGGVAAFPWAVSYAVTGSVVHDDAGPIPTEVSLAPGYSQLDLGPIGNVYDSGLESHGLGTNVKVIGPPDLLSAVAAGQSPHITDVVKRFADFYGDPSAIKDGYEDALVYEVTHHLVSLELEVGLSLSAVFGAVYLSSGKLLGRRPARWTTVGAVVVVTMTTTGLAGLNYLQWRGAHQIPDTTHALSAFDNTGLKDSVADNPLLAALIDNGKHIYDQEITRESSANRAFLDVADAGVEHQIDAGAISQPASGETMFLAMSDMHESRDMITVAQHVVKKINAKYGKATVRFVTSNGDNAYGESAAMSAIKGEAAIGDGAPTYSIEGNHDTRITEQQMKEVGMHVLKGKVQTAPGSVRLLGNDDPMITKLSALFDLSQSQSRTGSGETEARAGKRLKATAEAEHPTVLMVHEAYELAPVIGLADASQEGYDAWFARGDDTTGALPDDVEDQPAALETYGHWHRLSTSSHKLYRVVSNDDGTWTDVEELGTAGGANGSQSLGNLSTPWTVPAKTASMVLFTVNDESQLVTKRQQLDTSPAGTFDVEPAVHIGSSDGQPYPVGAG